MTPSDEPITDAAAALAIVSELAAQQGREDLVKRIGQELARAQTTDPPTVVVGAEVSCGKTTLVNTLIGRPELLPVAVDVATGVFVVVTHAQSPFVRVYTQGAAEPIESSMDEIADWASVTRNPDNEKRVLHVEVGVPSSLLAEGLRLVDTPGVGGLNSQHAEMTLTALTGADALVFVLDASAPLSGPELQFLRRASANIQTVIFVLSKADLNPGWRTVLDEDRRLLKEYAPRFANHRIFPVRAPDARSAERKRARGEIDEAERLAERSGLPALTNYLRTTVIQRTADVRQANRYRVAISVLAQLDQGCRQQEETLRGDKEPLQRLKSRQADLEQLQSSTNGWQQRTRLSFDELQRKLTHNLQEAANGLRAEFEEEIALHFRPQRHLSFSAELEVGLRRLTIELQRELAEGTLDAAADAARQIGVDEIASPEAAMVIPERETLSARPVDKAGAPQSRALGALILTEAAQVLRNIITSGGSPLSLLLAPIGFGSAIVGVVNSKGQRTQLERAEAKRLLQEYDVRFRRDATIALDEGIRAARDETVAALQRKVQERLQTIRGQIEILTAQAAEIAESENQRARLLETRRQIAQLQQEYGKRVQALAQPAATPANPPTAAVDRVMVSSAS